MPLPALSVGAWTVLPGSALRPHIAPTAEGHNLANIFDYSGGWWDDERQELGVWGGGHADWPGNEVFAFALQPGAWTQLTARSPYPYISSNAGWAETQDALADGNPSARHTSGGITRVNLPGWDGFFCHGGSLWEAGWPVNGTWFFHRDAGKWENLGPRPNWGGDNDYNYTTLYSYAAFDKQGGRVLIRTRNSLLSFTFATRTWGRHGSVEFLESDACAAYDEERKQFAMLGGTGAHALIFEVWDTAVEPWVQIASALSLTGPAVAEFASVRGQGFAFDSKRKQYLVHVGGRDFYLINRDTWAVTKQTGAGADPGPMYAAGSGNMNRFQYAPSLDAIVVVSTIDSGVAIMPLGTVTPPPTALIPENTWIAIRNPTALTGPGYVATLLEKHGSLASVPGRGIYQYGGDTRHHFIGPNFEDFNSSSYYQGGPHLINLTKRLQSPGDPNAGYSTERSYCSAGPDDPVPKRPDFVGIQWVPWHPKGSRLVIVPGLFYTGSSCNCPGETEQFVDDPGYPHRKIMSFDPDAKVWTVDSANHGVRYTGSTFPWHFYADALAKRYVRVEFNGSLIGEHYDPATDQWTYFDTNVPLRGDVSHFAVLGRRLYVADREHGQFGYYDLDAHTATVMGSLPGDVWPSDRVPADKGYIFAVPRANTLVYVERRDAGDRVWAWRPDVPTPAGKSWWLQIDTLPKQTLDGEPLPPGEIPHATCGVLDEDTGILYLTGEYSGTADYSWAIHLTGTAPTPPPSGGGMATCAMTVQTQDHDFPAGTVPGQYRLALTSAAGQAIVQLVPYGGTPVVATFQNVPAPGDYQATAALLASDGTTVLWSAPPIAVNVPAPPPSAVTLKAPTSISVTITG